MPIPSVPQSSPVPGDGDAVPSGTRLAPGRRPRWTVEAGSLCAMGASELNEAFAAKRLSPVEIACAALDRAETIQPLYNAFTQIDRTTALAQARASEARWHRGTPLSPVDGMPATIKDIVWVAGWPARYGSPSTSAAACETDASAVARMRAAGLIWREPLLPSTLARVEGAGTFWQACVGSGR